MLFAEINLASRSSIPTIITENDKVKVKKITFIGNRELKDSYLKSRLFTQEAGFFSALSSSGSFKQEAFERDIQVFQRQQTLIKS